MRKMFSKTLALASFIAVLGSTATSFAKEDGASCYSASMKATVIAKVDDSTNTSTLIFKKDGKTITFTKAAGNLSTDEKSWDGRIVTLTLGGESKNKDKNYAVVFGLAIDMKSGKAAGALGLVIVESSGASNKWVDDSLKCDPL